MAGVRNKALDLEGIQHAVPAWHKAKGAADYLMADAIAADPLHFKELVCLITAVQKILGNV